MRELDGEMDDNYQCKRCGKVRPDSEFLQRHESPALDHEVCVNCHEAMLEVTEVFNGDSVEVDDVQA